MSGFCMKMIVVALACACGLVAGCSDSTAASAPIAGTFSLSRVNGKVLPDTEAIAYSPDPRALECALLRTGGSLTLDATAGTFAVTVTVKNACSGGEDVHVVESGTYAQHGRDLTFSESLNGGTVTLTGQIDDANIMLRTATIVYTFAR